jgi:hypothetical protein
MLQISSLYWVEFFLNPLYSAQLCVAHLYFSPVHSANALLENKAAMAQNQPFTSTHEQRKRECIALLSNNYSCHDA